MSITALEGKFDTYSVVAEIKGVEESSEVKSIADIKIGMRDDVVISVLGSLKFGCQRNGLNTLRYGEYLIVFNSRSEVLEVIHEPEA